MNECFFLMAEKYFIIVLFLCHLQQIHTLSCVHDRDCLSNEFSCDQEYVYKCDLAASTCTCHECEPNFFAADEFTCQKNWGWTFVNQDGVCIFDDVTINYVRHEIVWRRLSDYLKEQKIAGNVNDEPTHILLQSSSSAPNFVNYIQWYFPYNERTYFDVTTSQQCGEIGGYWQIRQKLNFALLKYDPYTFHDVCASGIGNCITNNNWFDKEKDVCYGAYSASVVHQKLTDGSSMSAAWGGDGYCYSAPQSIVDGISAKQACCICCDNYPRWEHYTYKQIACHKANDFIEIKHEPTYEIYDPMVWQYGSNGLTSVQPMVSSAYPKIAFSDFKTPRECLYAIQFQGYGRKNFHPKTFAWQYVSGGRSRCFYANPQMSDQYLEELEYMYTCIGGVNVEGSQFLNTYQHNDFAAIEQIWNSVTAEPVVTTTPEPVDCEPVIVSRGEPYIYHYRKQCVDHTIQNPIVYGQSQTSISLDHCKSMCSGGGVCLVEPCQPCIGLQYEAGSCKLCLSDSLQDSFFANVYLLTATSECESVVTTTPEPVVTTTPEPVVTTTPEPVVTTTPEPVVTTTPEPVVTTTPEPVVTTTPEQVVTTPPALPFTVVEGACFIGGAHANVASSAQSCYENVQYYVGNYYLSSGTLIPWNVIYFLPSQTCMYFDVSSSDLIKVSNPSAESCTRGIYYEDWSTFLRGNEPVVTTTPEPVVTTTPEPVVTTTTKPRNDIVLPIIAGCVATFVIVLAAIYGCYKYKAKAAPYAPDSGLNAYQPMINTRDMTNAINSENLT